MAGENRYTIDILDLTLDVIELLHSAGDQLQGPSDVARALGINRSRAFRILRTLEQRGYVEGDGGGDGYKLGLRFLEIGEALRGQLDVRRAADTVMTELARATGDTANLMVRSGSVAILLDSRRGHHRLQIEDPIGKTLPLHVGASPKLLLAFVPEPEREQLLANLPLTRFTPHTIADCEQLRQRLAEIRQSNYAVDEEDFEIGVYSVGAPIRDQRGLVVAGISVVVPGARFSPARRELLIAAVVDAAAQVSHTLGWREPLL